MKDPKPEPAKKSYPNIDPAKNYLYGDSGRVFTGTQILNLLEVASETMQANILLLIRPTHLAPTDPDSTYGI